MNDKKIIFLGNGYFINTFNKINKFEKTWKYSKINCFIKKIGEKINRDPKKFLKDTGWIKKGSKRYLMSYIENYPILTFVINEIFLTEKNNSEKMVSKQLENVLDEKITLEDICNSLNYKQTFGECFIKGTCKIKNDKIICKRTKKNINHIKENGQVPPTMISFTNDRYENIYKSFYIWIIMYWIFENLFYIKNNEKIRKEIFKYNNNILKKLEKYEYIFSLNYFNITESIFHMEQRIKLKLKPNQCKSIPANIINWKSIHINIESKSAKYEYKPLAEFFDTLTYSDKYNKEEIMSNLQAVCDHLYSEKIIISKKQKTNDLYNKSLKKLDNYWLKLKNIDFFGIKIEEPLLKYLCSKIKKAKNNNVVFKISYNCECSTEICSERCNDYEIKQKWREIIKEELESGETYSEEFFKNNIQIIRSEEFFN